MPLNIEIKARCAHPNQVKSILQAKNADFKGFDHQIDTYFKVNHGRLKLREGSIENNLIHYNRPNQEGPKRSEVILYQSNPDSTLKSLLTAANGILTVVDKQRAIYFIDNVKFHVDEVQDLGSFVEIEAIDTDGSISEASLQEQCEFYMQLLHIQKEDLLDVSYSDLLMEKNQRKNKIGEVS